jgi:hypothetical protein
LFRLEAKFFSLPFSHRFASKQRTLLGPHEEEAKEESNNDSQPDEDEDED